MNEDAATMLATNVLSRFEKVVTGYGLHNDSEHRVWRDLVELLKSGDPGECVRRVEDLERERK